MTYTNEEIADLLDRAHDELLVRGWTFGKLVREDGSVCALGGISAAEGRLVGVDPNFIHEDDYPHDGLGRAAASALADTVTPDEGHPLDRVYCWNDHPGRVADDVFDAFTATAKKLRETT